MIIDFKHMEEQILPNFKGGEKAYAVKKFTDDRNMIMHGRLESGASIGLHTHEGNCEMFYIIEEQARCLWTASMKGLKQACATIARKVIHTALLMTATPTLYSLLLLQSRSNFIFGL